MNVRHCQAFSLLKWSCCSFVHLKNIGFEHFAPSSDKAEFLAYLQMRADDDQEKK